MQSLTLAHPFWAEAHESVPAIFWRLILRCGVVLGLACALMLWGVREPVVAIGSLVLVSAFASVVARRLDSRWTVARCVLLAGRTGVYLASSAAIVEIAQAAGVLLVTLCLALTPSVRRACGDLGRYLLHVRRTAPTHG